MQGLRKTFWLFVVLLVTACGGGGGGGDGGSSSVSVLPPPPDPIPQGNLNMSGTISVSAALAVDRDTRDPRAPDKSLPSNDLPYDIPRDEVSTYNNFEAQLIPSPGTVGGYVSLTGFKNQRAQGDVHDFYRVSLREGQEVSLQIADYIQSKPAAVDFDLVLLDLDGKVLQVAAILGPVEVLPAPSGIDEYLVLVTACASDLIYFYDSIVCGSGRSNYTLTVGDPEDGAIFSSLRSTDEFVLNEALVVYADELQSNEFRATASALQTDDERLGDVQRIKLTSDILFAKSSALQSEEEFASVSSENNHIFKVAPELQERIATLAAIKSLQQQENVVWAEPNFIREQLSFTNGSLPNDPGYPLQWHYPLINVPAAWDLGVNGSNVTVAVLDTGILPFHDDIKDQLDLVTGGYDFVSSTYYSLDGDPADDDPTDPGDGRILGYSSSFHGTHVAGTIAAATDNNTGVAGIAYGANILPVRVLGRGVGTSFDIARGLCFAAGLTTGSCEGEGFPGNDNPADVINLSLGGSGSSQMEQQLFDEITAAGILVVAAAGNSSSPNAFYPASYDGVFSVSALDLSASLSPYSNYGPNIDLAAPGGDSSRDLNGDGYVDGVLSTGGDDSVIGVEYTYPFFQGTSMAAPHVAGVFALMRSVNAQLDTQAMDQLLRNGEITVALGDQTLGERDYKFGYGMIDAAKAVSAALSLGGEAPTPVPWLAAVPNRLNFGATFNSIQFTLRNNSSGPLDIVDIVSDQSWLIAPVVNGLGTYQLLLNRNGLEEGSYEGALTITSSVNEVKIKIIMQVNKELQSGDAGHIYVRLIDPETGNIRDVEADAVGGEYIWQIDNLPPGNYQLVTFTDADNDGQVCDGGEACGSYLTTDQPILIDMRSDLTAIDFPLNHGVDLDLTIPIEK